VRFAADREPERQFHVSNPPCDRLGRRGGRAVRRTSCWAPRGQPVSATRG